MSEPPPSPPPAPDPEDEDATPGTLTGRLVRLLAQELSLDADAAKYALEKGPLTAYARVAKDELGGPILRWSIRGVGMPIFPSPIAVLALPVILSFGVLALTDSVLGSSLAVRLLLAAIVTICGLIAVVAIYGVALRPTRRMVLGAVGGWGLTDIWIFGSLVVLLPTVALASVTALLVHAGVIPVAGVAATDGQLAFRTAETYLWNLADSVPLLKVPTTLHWMPKLEFSTAAGGALVLAYKLLLVVPLVQLATIAVKQLFGDESGEASADSAANDPG
jgi:hypothetical protein